MSAELADTTPTWAENARTREAELVRRVSEAVFIVSPFREVVENLREVAGNRLLPRSNRLGTIHTTQGKEADVVILVLGTATDQPGSRAWASRRPNLLDVAVTRARRRLVVGGDYRNWSRQRNFSVLARYGASDPGSLLRVVDAVTEWPLQRSADAQA
jgi:superfamily I DNA and/or RNA helicase